MKRAHLTTGQQRLLDRFTIAGGVVEYVVVECDEASQAATEQARRSAVTAGMNAIQHGTDAWANAASNAPEAKRSGLLDVEEIPSMSAKRLNHTEFFGPRYDFERQGLIVRGKGTFLNEFFFYLDEPISANIIPSDKIDHGVGTGYAYAFSFPPYGLSLPPEEVGELFEKINSFILGGVTNQSVIFQWPTNWSNYFDDGEEWWGSFLWSFANPGSSQIAVLAASTTD